MHGLGRMDVFDIGTEGRPPGFDTGWAVPKEGGKDLHPKPMLQPAGYHILRTCFSKDSGMCD